jgi:hypothetical protein
MTKLWNQSTNIEAMRIFERIKSAIMEDIREGIYIFDEELINQLISLLSTYECNSDTSIYHKTL